MLRDLDATAQAELVARGEVSATELLEAAIARADATASTLNAVPIRFDDVARAQIAAAGGKLQGPFAGVPFLLKDRGQDFAGQLNTGGAVAYKNRRATDHSFFTRRCLAAGLVIFGRTATPELALRAVTETKLWGPTRNPWDMGRTPGGSSGGAAAAVAGGIVAAAGASDGGGSIRIPASFTGLFGLKPTSFLVSNGPHEGLEWEGAVSHGVLTKSVRDCAGLLDILTGPEPGDPVVASAPNRPFTAELGQPPGRLRIGFSTQSPLGTKVDPACIAVVEKAASLLESLGHHVEPAAPAFEGAQLSQSFLTMFLGHVAAELAQSGAPRAEFEPDTAALAEFGRALSAGAYVRAHWGWHGLRRSLAAFHARYDLWLLPTVAAPPARIGELASSPGTALMLDMITRLRLGKLALRLGVLEKITEASFTRTPFTQISNLTFTPSMSVPLHRAPAAAGGPELPIGVQFVAAPNQDATLFRLAAQLEQAAPWPRTAPSFS